MPLVYSAVARGSVILAEYSVFAGNFPQVAKDCLDKSKNADGKYTYTIDNHTFCFLHDHDFTYVSVADEATGRAIPTAFLDKAREEFLAKYSEKGKTASAGNLTKSFGPKLKALMEHVLQYPEEYSKISSVQKKVDEVKGIMQENIEKVLSRGEALDNLVDKTDNLMHEADRFAKTGRSLRRKMWWQNMKMKLVLAMVVILVGIIIFLLVCFSGHNCLKH